MDVYDSELKELDEKLSTQNVISDENVISVYDLYNILNKKFEKLRSVTQSHTIFSSKEIFNHKKYKEVMFGINCDTSQITIFPNMRFDSSFHICKDHNNDEFYLAPHYKTSRKFMNNFIIKYYDEIMYVFSVLEEYSPLVTTPLDSVFKCGKYSFKIDVDGDGNVNLKIIDDSKQMNLEEMVEKENHKLLSEEVKLEFAKKIVVNIDLLNESLQKIITEHFAEKEKVKVIAN